VFIRAAGAALLLASVTAEATDRRTQVVALPPDRAIVVDLTIGTLRVQGEPRRDAEIDIARHARDAAALARIPVVVDETPKEVRIRARQADGGTDPSLRTDVTLRVPHAARLAMLQVMEGRIALSALSGVVTADLRRGPIDATDLRGTVRLETGIGDVTATRMRLSPDGLLRLRAFNGNVRLSLAERPPDARVMALALNGSIRSTIPLTMRDTWGPHWGEATLGNGEPVISIDVVTGEIEIAAPK
jgi:hypothetical protein